MWDVLVGKYWGFQPKDIRNDIWVTVKMAQWLNCRIAKMLPRNSFAKKCGALIEVNRLNYNMKF